VFHFASERALEDSPSSWASLNLKHFRRFDLKRKKASINACDGPIFRARVLVYPASESGNDGNSCQDEQSSCMSMPRPERLLCNHPMYSFYTMIEALNDQYLCGNNSNTGGMDRELNATQESVE
jgi:hypothetical protein